jgi:hypothetical protein
MNQIMISKNDISNTSLPNMTIIVSAFFVMMIFFFLRPFFLLTPLVFQRPFFLRKLVKSPV